MIIDVSCAQRVMSSNTQAYATAYLAEFHQYSCVFVVSKARASVLFWYKDSKQTELAHFFHDVDRENFVVVPVLPIRSDFALSEVPHHLGK